jgi:outer membrane protein
VAALSGEGKLAAAKVQALIQRKQAEAATRQKALAENQNKLQQSGALLSDAARTQLEREIERQNVEGQRFQQDAQTEINDMNQQLQAEFEQKLRPVLDELAREKKLYLLLSAADAGLVWADPALDLTLDVVQRLDARSAPAPAPAAAPAAAPRP